METSRLQKKLTFSIAPNQGGSPMQGVRVPSLEVYKAALCQEGVSALGNALTFQAFHMSYSLQ